MQRKNGVSLIVLVITIIVMIILASAIILALSNTGIMDRAEEAVDATNKQQLQAIATLGWSEAYLSGARTEAELKAGVVAALEENGLNASEYGIIVTTKGVDIAKGWIQNDKIVTKGNTTVAIGDYVNYTYPAASAYSLPKELTGWDTDQSIEQVQGAKWRVLGANENGQLELLGMTHSVLPVCLKNAAGYNNGVFILNDICAKQYSNSALGAVGRSINLDDLEKQYNADGIAARDSYIQPNSGLKYGATKTYGAEHNSYPVIYAQEALSGVNGSIRQDGISASDSFYNSKAELTGEYATATGNLVGTQTYYTWTNARAYFKNSTFYDMIFTFYYWLATRDQVAGPNNIGFGLFRIAGGTQLLGAEATFNSGKVVTQSANNTVRPVVTLGQDVVVTTNATANSATNMWQLSK